MEGLSSIYKSSSNISGFFIGIVVSVGLVYLSAFYFNKAFFCLIVTCEKSYSCSLMLNKEPPVALCGD